MWNNDSHLVKSPLLISWPVAPVLPVPTLWNPKGEPGCRFWKGNFECSFLSSGWKTMGEDLMSCFRLSVIFCQKWQQKRFAWERGPCRCWKRTQAGGGWGVRVTDLWPLGGGGFWDILVRGWGLLKDPFSVTWPSHSHLHNTPTPPTHSDWDLFKIRSGWHPPTPPICTWPCPPHQAFPDSWVDTKGTKTLWWVSFLTPSQKIRLTSLYVGGFSWC